jgi:hypothetical protein
MKRNVLTSLERTNFTLTDQLKQILVGLLLGDLYAQKRGKMGNTVFRFEQGTVHEDYINYLYELFKSYCPSTPKINSRKPNKITMKIYSRIYFLTYTLPCFNDLYLLFYPAGKKVIPANIAELLTPLSLAYLIADDGSWNNKGRYVVLCTDSFPLEEVEHLVSVLNEKFNLKCYVNKNGIYSRIILPSYSIIVLQNLLASHMPPMMRHKIGL